MENNPSEVFFLYGIFTLLLLICGIYYLLMTKNLIRILIGLELLTKAVTLLLILSGYLTGNFALAQTLVITLIVIEVVVIVVAAGIVLWVHKHFDSMNVKNLQSLKG
jgi:multisubunit Na+/H+ antiporter MnhC subunit